MIAGWYSYGPAEAEYERLIGPFGRPAEGPTGGESPPREPVGPPVRISPRRKG